MSVSLWVPLAAVTLIMLSSTNCISSEVVKKWFSWNLLEYSCEYIWYLNEYLKYSKVFFLQFQQDQECSEWVFGGEQMLLINNEYDIFLLIGTTHSCDKLKEIYKKLSLSIYECFYIKVSTLSLEAFEILIVLSISRTHWWWWHNPKKVKFFYFLK